MGTNYVLMDCISKYSSNKFIDIKYFGCFQFIILKNYTDYLTPGCSLYSLMQNLQVFLALSYENGLCCNCVYFLIALQNSEENVKRMISETRHKIKISKISPPLPYNPKSISPSTITLSICPFLSKTMHFM